MYFRLPFCSTALVLPKVKPWWAQSSSMTCVAALFRKVKQLLPKEERIVLNNTHNTRGVPGKGT